MFEISINININICIDNDNPRSHTYLELLAMHGILPAHRLPTRIKTCSDHIILKTRLPAYCFVAETSVTDHDSIMLYLKMNLKNMPKLKSTNIINYKNLDSCIKSLDFSPTYAYCDVNLATNFLLSKVTNALASHTKVVKFSCRKMTLKPWMPPGPLRCLRNRDTLHQTSKKHPDNEMLTLTFKRYRNFCSS